MLLLLLLFFIVTMLGMMIVVIVPVVFLIFSSIQAIITIAMLIVSFSIIFVDCLLDPAMFS